MTYLTYRELLTQLNNLTEEQLNQTVTVFHGSQDEYYPVHSTGVTNAADTLDADHFYLDID